MIRSIVVLVVLLTAFIANANRIDFTVKAAVVDVQAILENSEAVKNLRKEMDQISHNIQKEMSNKEAELKKHEQGLVSKKGVLSEEDFQKEIDKFNVMVSKAQKNMQSKKEGLEKTHADAMNQVHDATIEVIGKLADEQGFNMAIPSSQVLFVKGYLDVTTEVIKRLNESLKTVKINYQSK